MNYWLAYSLILILVPALLFGLLRLSERLSRGRPQIRAVALNLLLSLLAIFFTLMTIEFYFKVFFAQSDAYVFSLSAQNWQERYWYPINSLGYRDREWSEAEVSGKLKVMVVGDSIASGLGIKDYRDRFSNKLNDLLGDQAVVFNVASPGWHTRQEIEAVIKYPYRPDVLIWTYFINDIEGAAFHQGVERPKFVQEPPAWLRPLVDHSYAFNFLYWRWVRLGRQEGQADYYQWVSKTFRNPEVWWVHQQELQRIVDGAKAEGISLIVVVVPNLTSIEEDRQITGPVLDYFKSQGIPTLDVAQLVAGKSPAELIASPVDAHPNEAVNLQIAQALFQMLQKNRATTGQ